MSFFKVLYSPDGKKLTSLRDAMQAGVGLEYLPGEIVRATVGPILAYSTLDAAMAFVEQSTSELKTNLQIWIAEGELDQRYLGIERLIKPEHLSPTTVRNFWTKIEAFGDATQANPALDAYLQDKRKGLFLREPRAKSLEWIRLKARVL
jgi:hypothetical protein